MKNPIFDSALVQKGPSGRYSAAATSLALAGSIAAFLFAPVSIRGATVTWSGSASNVWGATGNWYGSAIPGTADTVLWDSNSTANLSGTLAATMSVGGLKLANPSGAVTISGSALTLGSGGIDMSAATQDLTINNFGGFSASQTWTVASGRTLAISNATNITVDSGRTLILAGAGTIALSGNITVVSGTSAAGLTVSSSSRLTSGATTNAYFGNGTGLATVTLKDSAVWSGTYGGSGITINVGYAANSRAVLNVQDSAQLVLKSTANTGNLNIGTLTSVAGALNQSGGFVSVDNQFMIGLAGSGFYSLSSGTVTVTGSGNAPRFRVGGPGGVGVFWQQGGLVSLPAAIGDSTNGLQILGAPSGPGASGFGTYYMTSGTLTSTGNNLNIGARNGQGDLTISGVAQVNFNAGAVQLAPTNNDAGMVGILNLTGGTLQAGSVIGVTGANQTSYVNFSGGTLKANAATTTFMQGNTRATINGGYTSGGTTYAGGATIDTNGSGITIGQNLLALSGNGVAVPGSFTPITGLIGAPFVQVLGSGSGATAQAIYDSASGAVTGITVTNPGNDYTGTPSFRIFGGGLSGTTTVTGTTVANTSGGLTKTGAGTLTLSGSNNFTGVTTISAGTLALASAGALAGGGAVTFGGGTLQFSGSNTGDYGARIVNSPGAISLDTNSQSVLFSGSLTSSNTGGLTKSGIGTLTLAGNNTYLGATVVRSGSLAITGSTALDNATGSITVADTSSAAVLTLSGNGRLTSGTATNAYIGNGTGLATVTLKDSAIWSGTYGGSGRAINVGYAANSRAVLNVQDSAQLVLKSTTDTGNLNIGSSGASAGALNQSGGIVSVDNRFTIGTGIASSGFYGLSSGTLSVTALSSAPRFRIGQTGGAGVFWQQGGLVSLPATIKDTTTYGLQIVGAAPGGGGAAGYGTYYMTGGTLTSTGNDINVGGKAGQGDLTIGGAAQANINTGAVQLAPAGIVNEAGMVGILNLTGGSLQAGSVVGVSGSNQTSYVNFSGGTLKPSGSTTSFMLGSTRATINGGYTSGGTTYAGGANIDTNGFNITIGQNLLAPSGSGVGVPASFTPISGLIGAPFVQVLGSGSGATAQAIYDSASGAVTGITVTNPGNDYTGTPSFRIFGGGLSGTTTVSGTTVANTSGGLTKTGAGTLTLSGSNNFTGGVNINTGTLQLGGTGALNSVAGSENVVAFGAGSTGALSLNGNSVVIANLSSNVTAGTPVVQNANASAAVLTVGNSVNLSGTFSGGIQNGSGGGALSLTKAGTGTLTLTGSNSYSGGTTINAGTLQVGDGTSNTVVPSGTVTVNAGGTLVVNLANGGTFGGGIFNYGTVNLTNSGTNTLSGNIGGWVGAALNQSGAGTTILSGNNDFAGTINITNGVLQLNNQYAAYLSTVNVGVANGLTLATAATVGGLQVTNPSGAVTISGSALTLGSGGIDLSSATQDLTINKFGGFSASQTWTVASGRTLTIGGASNFTVDAGRTLTLSGSGAIAITGWTQVGSQGSTGTINQTGGTFSSTANERILFIGHSGNATAGTGVYNLSGGTIVLTSTAGNGIRLGQFASGANGTFNMTGGTINSTGNTALEVGFANGSTGAYNQSGGNATFGTVYLAANGSNSTIGTFSLSSGTLSITNGLSVGTVGNGTMTVSGGVLNLAGAATVSGGAGSSGTLTLNTLVNFTTTNAGISSGSNGTVVADSAIFSNQVSGTAGGTVSISTPMTINAGGLTIAQSSGGNRWLMLSGNLTGSGGITVDMKSGFNTTVFSGSNSFTGPITISSGYFNNNGNNAIPIGASVYVNGNWGCNGNATIGNLTGNGLIFGGTTNRVLTVGYGDMNGTFSGNIQDNNTLVKTGTGTLILTGVMSNTGGTTVNGGVLQVGNGGTSGLLSGNILNNAALAFNRSNALTFGGAITGSGSVIKNGAGTLTLSGSNTFSGDTVVNSGTLVLANTAALQNSTLNYDNQGGVLSFGSLTAVTLGGLKGTQSLALSNTSGSALALTVSGNNADTTYSGALTGSGTLNKVGSGTTILSGSLTIAGLSADAGAVQLAQSSSIGAVSIAAGATVALTAHSGSSYHVLETTSLTLSGSTSTLDLWNNAMILRASGTSENAANLAMVKAEVNTASNGLQWNGAGIGSTTAFNEAQPEHTQALAVMVYDNTVIKQSSFEGVSGLGYFDGDSLPVGFNQVLVKLTYLGDFNADGLINASDYTWLDGFALGGNTLGDLNGDGSVNATDYTWLDGSALNQSFGVLAAQQRSGAVISSLQGETAATSASSGAIAASPEAVPEPGGFGLIASGIGLLIGGRRLRRRAGK